MSTTKLAITAVVGSIFAGSAAPAQQPSLKMTLFGQPSVNNDSIWMALQNGFYQQEGLDVTYRLFPSGTTAFESFQSGQGDIVMTGDCRAFNTSSESKVIIAPSRRSSANVRSKSVLTRHIISATPLVTSKVTWLPAPGQNG